LDWFGRSGSRLWSKWVHANFSGSAFT